MYFSLVLLHCLFTSVYVFSHSNSLIQTSSRKYLLGFFKRRSKVSPNNMSQKSALNFDQWGTRFDNCKPTGDFVYKIAKNNCHLGYFAGLIQTQKRHSTSYNKMSVLTWILLVISSLFLLFLWTRLLENLLLVKFLMLYSINRPNFIAPLIGFTSWDIGQYMYCNCLIPRLWRHKSWNQPCISISYLSMRL